MNPEDNDILSIMPLILTLDTYVGRSSVQYLKTRGDKPFFLRASFNFSTFRPPNFWGPGKANPFPEERVQAAFEDPDTVTDVESLAGMLPEDVERRMIARYYGTLTLVDDCISEILTTLKDKGLLSNTIVVITSDHGCRSWYRVIPSPCARAGR